MRELESAVLADDMQRLRVANHRLNSASLVIGAVRLAASCNKLDRMLRTGGIGDATGLVRIVVDEYNVAEAALRSWCDRQALSRETEPKRSRSR